MPFVPLVSQCHLWWSMSSASVWLACVLHGYYRIAGHSSHLRLDMLSKIVAWFAICAIGRSVSLVVVNVICVFLANLYVAHLLQSIYSHLSHLLVDIYLYSYDLFC